MASLQLDSSQRKRLRGLAHSLKPLVTIGRRGLTENSLNELDSALEFHELIKIRLGDGGDLAKGQKRDLCNNLADQLECGLAGIVGHIGVLYRPARDPQKRRIKL